MDGHLQGLRLYFYFSLNDYFNSQMSWKQHSDSFWSSGMFLLLLFWLKSYWVSHWWRGRTPPPPPPPPNLHGNAAALSLPSQETEGSAYADIHKADNWFAFSLSLGNIHFEPIQFPIMIYISYQAVLGSWIHAPSFFPTGLLKLWSR